jgi:Putative DNA-binding domain
MLLVEKVQELIDQTEFPSSLDFADLFSDDGKRFISQEDVNWDFKDRWPFSYSDDYFLGIARLISAFANTVGGFIIFGVHDEKRTGGHNSVHVNTDKLRQSIIAYMGRCPDFQVRHYDLPGLGEIDCLFVRPRKMGEPPYRFVKETKYKQFVWVRDGHNVAKAEPRHIPLLYCRVDEQGQTDNMQGLSGSLPPSPRTIGKFIGRLRSMDYLFNWLYTSDEPLTYLYGKGGSGKTTIAHEFASVLKRVGANIRIYNNDSIDLVLFLSAKEKTFVPGDDSSIVSNEADFYDEKSLYVQVLKLFRIIH